MKTVYSYVFWIFLSGPGVRFVTKDALESKYFWLGLAAMIIISILFKDPLQRWADAPLFKPRPGARASTPNITYSSHGPSGQVHYRSREGNFDMYYEFGGGDMVAWLIVPSQKDWTAQTGIPLERRDEVLNTIGRQVVKDQTVHGRGSFKIEGNYLKIYA